ncbi:UNVERIFIED_CONTAM: hypothetical protein Sindi_0407300 [Sesamum indicum]
MLQPLHPYGVVLNLDVIDFQNIEKLIDELVVVVNITATTLELDKENFIKLLELSLEGSVEISGVTTEVAAPMVFAKICMGENVGPVIQRESSDQERGRSRVVIPTLGVPDEPLLGEERGDPNQKPEYTNLDWRPDQQGLHLRDLGKQMQDPHEEPIQEKLSDEPILEPIKVSIILSKQPHLKRRDIMELKFILAAPETVGKGVSSSLSFIKLQRLNMIVFNTTKAALGETP